MKIWKKAFSAGLAAMLLASVTASGALAIKGASGTADRTDALNCTAAADFGVVAGGASTCSQVADGISTVTLSGDGTLATAGLSLYITSTGASIISVAPGTDFTLVGGIVTTGVAPLLTVADAMTLRAPAAPGTATVSVYAIDSLTGIATLEGTMTITFTATSGLGVSEANSTVKLVADLTCVVQTTAKTAAVAALPAAPAAGLCVTLKNGNNVALTGAADVTITITPVGLAHFGAAYPGGTNGQIVTQAAVAGVANFQIINTGLSGVAAIGIQVEQGTTVTTFAPKTFTFTGALDSLTVTQKKFAVAQSATVAVPAAYAIADIVGKDTAGNALACDDLWTATSGTTTVFANANLDVVVTGALCEVQIIGTPFPATLGSTAITVKNAGATIAASPFTMNVSGAPATATVVFSATTIVPGGTATITVNAKDAGGRPVADGTASNLIVSAGAITPAAPATSNGKATATYLAPFNTGVVTALATVGAITGSGSANVSAPAPLPGTGTNASALGVTTAGPFSTATKVAALGTYQTFKISYGVGAAGQTVGILVATKNSAGVWSSWTRVTGRVADSAGNVYYYWRTSSASWISLRGDLSGNLSNAVQGRWR